MSYALEPQEPFGPGLRRILIEQAEGAAGVLEDVAGPDWDEAVHEARKSVKQCRAVIRLARPSIGPLYGAANRDLRDIGRSLSDARDAGVLAGTVADLANAFPEHADDPSFERVRRVLEERNRLVTEHARADGVHEQAAKRLRRVAAQVARGPWDAGGWDFVEGGLRREYRRGRSVFAEARSEPAGENVHAWRKRAKDHWYHLRLLREAWTPVLKQTAKVAHGLSDLLGDEHDLVVLVETLRAGDRDLGDPARAELLFTLAGHRRADLLGAAVPMGRRLYAEKPGRFADRMRRYWKAARAETAGRGGVGLDAGRGGGPGGGSAPPRGARGGPRGGPG